MTFEPRSKADLLADYRELLRIVKQRPAGILTQPETNKLTVFLEKCIAETETESVVDAERAKRTG